MGSLCTAAKFRAAMWAPGTAVKPAVFTRCRLRAPKGMAPRIPLLFTVVPPNSPSPAPDGLPQIVLGGGESK